MPTGTGWRGANLLILLSKRTARDPRGGWGLWAAPASLDGTDPGRCLGLAPGQHFPRGHPGPLVVCSSPSSQRFEELRGGPQSFSWLSQSAQGAWGVRPIPPTAAGGRRGSFSLEPRSRLQMRPAVLSEPCQRLLQTGPLLATSAAPLRPEPAPQGGCTTHTWLTRSPQATRDPFRQEP